MAARKAAYAPAATRAVIGYQKELPEIPGRRAWEKPDSHLIKETSEAGGYAVKPGRRPSDLLLVTKLREAVDAWRDSGYGGASDVSKRLFEYWFEQDHEVSGFDAPFRYHFCQREAIETLVYLVEIAKNRDAKALVQGYAEIKQVDLLHQSVRVYATPGGQRRVERYVPNRTAPVTQDLPQEDLRRYAFKLATGSGKTWVMAMAVVWSHFHKRMVAGSDLSTNFLVVAPNIIVYQRLAKDFGSNEIFHRLPLIPPEWKGSWHQKVILREGDPDSSNNLVLTNIQQLYESRSEQWTPENAVQALLGKPPAKDLASYEKPLLERLRALPGLVAINDEAHHVHREDLAWSQSLLSLHAALPKGLALWLDFSATPKDQGGMYFPWVVCDSPLAQAVEDRIVKAPIIVTLEDDKRYPGADPDHVTAADAVEKYGFWIEAAVNRWREHQEAYRKLGARPVLFIMTERNTFADAIGKHLIESPTFGFKRSEVLIIHTDTKGEITKADLETARQAARDVDAPNSRIKVIVSVMMLREGWDVRSVTVVLGLRPFTAAAEILPEQVVGRGLRLLTGIGPDTQTLEVLGTKNLLDVVRTQLEADGVGVAVTKNEPPPTITIEPVQARMAYDIAIPKTSLALVRNYRRLEELDVAALGAIFDQVELDESLRVMLRMEFATTETEIHQTDIAADLLPPAAVTILASLTNRVVREANLSGRFAEVYPHVKQYVVERCFGRTIDVEAESIRSHLRRDMVQHAIARYLARAIGELTVEKLPIKLETKDMRLSHSQPFQWRRDLAPQPLECDHTLFNYVATYNGYERRFAQFLDKAPDVLRFASLGTTEQGDSGCQFRVNYLKPSGAIGLYYPDWVVVQKGDAGEANWIIETKGRVWQGTEAKDEAIRYWCEQVSQATGADWQFMRVNQAEFDHRKPVALADLTPLVDAGS